MMKQISKPVPDILKEIPDTALVLDVGGVYPLLDEQIG